MMVLQVYTFWLDKDLLLYLDFFGSQIYNDKVILKNPNISAHLTKNNFLRCQRHFLPFTF